MERLNFFPSSPEGGIPATEYARAELLSGIANTELIGLSNEASDLIASDEVLHRMLTIKIEAGPELDPTIRAHLSRMIAARSMGMFDKIVDSSQQYTFWELVGDDVADDLAELVEYEDDLDDLPDLWDLAIQDLTGL